MKAKIVQHKEIINIYSRQNYMNYSDWSSKLKKSLQYAFTIYSKM